MGRLLCPKTPLQNKFYANSTKSGKLVQALAHLLVGSLLSPWDPTFPILPVGRARVLTRGPHDWTRNNGCLSWLSSRRLFAKSGITAMVLKPFGPQ